MNAITARSVLCVYPKHIMHARSFHNTQLGDWTSASPDVNNRQEVRKLDSNVTSEAPCGSDCPAAIRLSTDLKGFGQFVFDRQQGPPLENPQYAWIRQGVCWNHQCDNYAVRLGFPESPAIPANLYLWNDMNGKSYRQRTEET